MCVLWLHFDVFDVMGSFMYLFVLLLDVMNMPTLRPWPTINSHLQSLLFYALGEGKKKSLPGRV